MISRLELENWKSHKNSEFHFSKGTNVLVGVMGSGKTSVTDAICYALFGTFPALQSKRVSLSEVIMNKPNKMQNSKVSLEFGYNGKNYRIERSISRDSKASQAKLLENGKLKAGPKVSDVSKAIEELLELDYELFSRAVYSEQNQIDYFLRLSPSQRKEKFDELLEINKYETVRSNSVQLCNKLKKSIEEKNKIVQGLESKFEKKQVDELLVKIAGKEKENLELKKKVQDSGKELETLEKKALELESARKKFNSLREVVSGLSARTKEVESRISELEKKSGSIKAEDQIEEKEKALNDQLNQLKKLRQEQEELRQKLELLKEKKQFIEKEIKEKQKTLPKSKQELEETLGTEEKKLQDLKKQEGFLEAQFSDLLEKTASSKARLQELSDSKAKLLETQANCPVCLRELEEAKKQELLSGIERKASEQNAELEKFKEKTTRFETEKTELTEKTAKLQDLILKLKNSLPVFEEIEKNSLKIEEFESSIKEFSGKLSEQNPVSEKEIEKIEVEISRIEKAKELLQAGKQLTALKEQEEERKKQLQELKFDENVLEKTQAILSDVKVSHSSMKKQFESNVELIMQLQENLQKINEVINQIESFKAESNSMKNALEKLTIFTNTLKETQGQLRQELISVLNQAMHDIWQRVYPYKDFESARLEIENGSYELKVKELNGEWTRVEGILSGGERSAAAIAIRVAFSLVLTRNLSWLILDEPTHNLDANAVRVLSEMLHSHLPLLVDQVFVITHDSNLEKAASAAVYELKREKASNSASIPVQKA